MSSIARVQDELVTRLTEALEDIPVRYGFPLDEPDAYEAVYILEPRPGEYKRQRDAAGFIHEDYLLPILVVAYRPGDDAVSVRDSRETMVDLVEESLGEDDHLWGQADDAEVDGMDPFLGSYQDGYVASTLILLSVTERYKRGD